MNFNINDNIIAQLISPAGKKSSPTFRGKIIAINGTKCLVKWENAAIAARAAHAFSGHNVDMKYLTLEHIE